MAALRFATFTGEKPGRHPQKLELSDAVEARNVRLLSGALEPWREPAHQFSSNLNVGAPRTIFKTQYHFWLEWSTYQSVTNSILSNDPYERVFFTDGGAPRVVDRERAEAGDGPFPSNSVRLGVPAPEYAGSPSVVEKSSIEDPPEHWSDVDDLDPDRMFDFTYAITYVNEFGEEGPPGPAIGPVEVPEDSTVQFPLPGLPTVVDQGEMLLKEYYVYRSSGGGPFQFIDNVPVSDTQFTDFTDPGMGRERLESENWDMPPEELDGLVVVAGNYLAGFRHNEVLFSEAGLAHAWPTPYRQPTDYAVVALGTFGQTLVVLTQGSVYMGQGSHPSAITLTNTAFQQPCVSRESVVSLMGGVAYASPDGLVYVTGQGPQIVTQDIFDRRSWRRLNPRSIRAASWYHLYIGFYETDDGETGGFIFDPRRVEWGVVFLDSDYPDAVFTDLEEDVLYLALGTSVRSWDAGDKQTYRWRSRPADLPVQKPVGVARVAADGYPVTLRLFRDGERQAEAEVGGNHPVRLPDANLGRTYQVEVETQNTVYEVQIASSVRELIQG